LFNDEVGDGDPSRRHHLKFNQSWSIYEELRRIEYQGEHVYHTSAHNALALRMIIDQLTPLLPTDSEEVNVQVKHLQAMLDAAIMVDPTLDRGDRGWGQDPDHRQSPRGHSANNITPLEERGQDRDNRDLRDVIHNRYARG
jgi:hypothetical protein